MALIFTSYRIIYQGEPRDKNIKRLRTLYISGIFDKTFYFMYQSRTVIQAKVRNHEIFHEGSTWADLKLLYKTIKAYAALTGWKPTLD